MTTMTLHVALYKVEFLYDHSPGIIDPELKNALCLVLEFAKAARSLANEHKNIQFLRQKYDNGD